MKMFQSLLLITLSLLMACSDYNEYSPNQVSDNDSPRELNKINLDRLYSNPVDDTITLAFLGDSQNFYNEVESFVTKVNQLDNVDLVIIAGDISDYGLLQEFEWVHERLDNLHKPFIGVIGNHDLVANGEEVYKKMFGALNFSFVYNRTKFVIHNTNSREYVTGNVPDMDWLRAALTATEGVDHFVGISHVPPFSGDFNPEIESHYSDLLRTTSGFAVSLHGHIHRHTDGYPYEDHVRYITGQSFEQKSFVLLKLASGVVSKRIIEF